MMDQVGAVLKIWDEKTDLLLIARTCKNQEEADAWFEKYSRKLKLTNVRKEITALPPRI
jgi:hypothetical protein